MRSIAKSYWIAVALLGAWLLAWIVITWPAMMDDALIHLRFADHLWRQHIVSYDGVQRVYGASSLLYVTLLAVLRGLVSTSPVLPRAVSSVALIVFFAGLAAGMARRLRDAKFLAWSLSILLLAILVMPSSIRWLDDGMETAITLLLTALLAFVAWDYGTRRNDARMAAALFALGYAIVMLRVEMLLLVGIVSATMLCMQRERRSAGARRWARVVVECAAPLGGGLLAALDIMIWVHALLPDTALAKSFGFEAWRGSLVMIAKTFAASMSFGMGLLALWLLTLVAVVAVRRGRRLTSLIANSPFPLVLLLTLLRGQAVQGVRYFEWALLFSTIWNILTIAAAREETSRRVERVFNSAAAVLGVCLLVAGPVEIHLLMPFFHAREDVLAEFRQQDLERLSNLRVVAVDVGYVGYFTGAPLCDMAGLVNGRGAAMMSYEQRAERCAAWQPQVGFLNRDQIKDLSAKDDLSGWFICGQYDYANLHEQDMHYLIAAPDKAKEVCAAAHGAPHPLVMLR